MKIAILGGGMTGLTAAYYLAKKGQEVTIFEKEKFLGGMAAGFKAAGWNWYLEKTYHHLFANDRDFLNFAKEIGFNKIFFRWPETASLYANPKSQILSSKQILNSNIPNSKQKPNFKSLGFRDGGLFGASKLEFSIYPLDTPSNLLKFPILSWSDKFRAGLVLVFLKLSPPFSFYERETSERFLRKTMGDRVWRVLWQELFRKKFGKYAEKILASFFWARIKKRTKKLGYIEGGFQQFINFLEERNKDLGAIIKKNQVVTKIKKSKGIFQIYSFKRSSDRPLEESWVDEFDVIISTLPTPILLKTADQVFSKDYLNRLSKIKYLHAVNLILETKKPLLKKSYWLNNAVSEIPIMGFFQHTNFIDKAFYNNNHILYMGWCVDENDKLLKIRKEEVLNFVSPYLYRIANFQSLDFARDKFSISNFYLFKTPFAQPIFDKEFLKNKPDFKTPLKNFYIANLDMCYPYDRGTNYAVKLGREVSGFI